MKKILTIVFIFSVSLSWAQKNRNDEKRIFIGLTAASSGEFKKKYHPTFTPFNYPYSYKMETDYPGSYTYPVWGYLLSLSYEFPLKKGFFLSSGVFFSDKYRKRTRSIDSVKYYYLFPESFKKEIPRDIANAPVLTKTNEKNLGLKFTAGYQYNRFSTDVGLRLNILSLQNTKKEFISFDINENSLYLLRSEYYTLSYYLSLKYRLTSGRYPVWVHLSIDGLFMFGASINIKT